MIEYETRHGSCTVKHPSGCVIHAEAKIKVREHHWRNDHGPDIGSEPMCDAEAEEVVCAILFATTESGVDVPLPDDWRVHVAAGLMRECDDEYAVDPEVIEEPTDAE